MMCEPPFSLVQKAHAVWRDPAAPVMVTLPAGEFVMGENPGDKFANDTERPAHRVVIPAGVALGCYPVTAGEYRRFQPQHSSLAADDLPVVRVSWQNAMAYCRWLTELTRRNYRLPSEAEWEYACRAGAAGLFASGEVITTNDANFLYDENGNRIGAGRLREVGSYPPNSFGFHDLHGNVCEWVADAWHANYFEAPVNGEAWMMPENPRRVVRGGAWDYLPRLLRSACRDWRLADECADNVGFRVATSDLRELA